MSFSGFVQAGLQVGLDSVLIRPTRGLYGIIDDKGTQLPSIVAHATIEERHHDDLEVTDHPVEQGAMISDHAFKRPAEVTLKLGWSNSPTSRGGIVNALIGAASAANPTALGVANVDGLLRGVQGIQSAMSGSNVDQIHAIYQQLLQLQSSRAIFTLYTGKRLYTNMVCKSISTESDFKSANSLPITMICKQIIIVKTQTVALPKETQKNPESTASSTNKGTIPAKPISSVGEKTSLSNVASESA